MVFLALLQGYNLIMFLALHPDLTLQNILEQDFQVSRNLKRKFSGRKRGPNSRKIALRLDNRKPNKQKRKQMLMAENLGMNHQS